MRGMNLMPADTDFGLPEHLASISGSSLSWNHEKGERRRLTVITALAILLFVPLALVIPVLDVPEPERERIESLPPQLARLLVKPEVIERPAPEPVKEVVPEPEPPKPAQVKSEPKPEPRRVPQVTKPVAQKAPAKLLPEPANQNVTQAREKASRSGLLTMRDHLAAMRKPEPKAAPVIQANAGSVFGAGKPARAEAQRSEDTLQGSGGVADAQPTRTDVEVAGHDVRKVEAVQQVAESQVAKVEGAPVPKQKPSVGERAMSNIRQVFDSGKTALYSLYQRELRQDPTLAGKVLLELVIEPDGSVSACNVISSELGNLALAQKIAMRVRLFNFGAANVEARKIRFPIDFLPG